MTKVTMYRQGDVLVLARTAPVPQAKPVTKDGARVVLAYGEVTGHAHALHGSGTAMLEALTGERFLTLDQPDALVHEEHTAPTLPALPCGYDVVRQVTYSPEMVREVAD